jgi:hypothetical protein
MRHTATTAAVAVLLLALTTTACGSSSDGGDGKPAAKTPTTKSSAARADEFLAVAHDIPFSGSGPEDDELLEYPPKWCEGLDGGHSAAWLFSGGGGNLYPIGMDWGTVKKDANTLLVAGVKAYCPKHSPAVLDELRASGEY